MGNSAESVAIRRAFMTSITSSAASARRDDDGIVELWSQSEIIEWVSGVFDCHVDPHDRISSARNIWREWEKANQHFPHQLRVGIVKTIDDRLQGRGFPSLRQLLETT